jgi:hypothetical protein
MRVHNNVNLMKATVRPGSVLCNMGRRMSGKGRGAVYKEDFALQVDCVLLAIGREPRIHSLGLDKAGVEVTKNGVTLDSTGVRSATAPHVYVAGDVASEIGLVNVAQLGARRAIEYMFDPSQFSKQNLVAKYNYENVSSVLFISPALACVGLTERVARLLGIPYTVAVLDLALISRALINYQRNPSRLAPGAPVEGRMGFVKMIVTNDEHKILLGMRCAGRDVSAVIESAALLVRDRRSVREMLRILHPHPSISEAVQECARMVVGHSLFKHHLYCGTSTVRSYSEADLRQHGVDVDPGQPVTWEAIAKFLGKQDYDDEEAAEVFEALAARHGDKVPVTREQLVEVLKATAPPMVPSYMH